MKAVVKPTRAPGLALQDVPVPEPKPNELLVKVRATSRCGSDLNCYCRNEYAEQLHRKIPFVPGHVYSGEVVAAGGTLRSSVFVTG